MAGARCRAPVAVRGDPISWEEATSPMDPDLIATALAHARQRIADDPPAGSSCLAVQAIGYARPTSPDAHGFVAIGELHDRARARLAIVVWHPDTAAVRFTWTASAAKPPDEP